MDTAHEMFAQMFRNYREAAGSVSECAEFSGYSHAYISDIQHGKKVPPLHSARDFDQTFGARGVLYDAAKLLREADRKAASIGPEDHVDSPDDGEMDEVERRQLLQALGLTGLAGQLAHVEAVRATLEDAVGRSVEEWQEVAFDYGRDMLTLPPADLVDDLSRDVLAVRRLLDRPGSGADRASLQRVAGQLSAVMAMTLNNVGQSAHARRWWRTAVVAADRSGDAELGTWVRGRQAIFGLFDGRDPSRVVDMADRALERAPQQIGAGMCVLSARAQALALRGDPEARAAVDRVAGAFEQLPGAVTSDRATVYGWSAQRLRHTQSYVYARLGDRQGPAACDAALALYPDDLYQEPTQVKLYRAAWMVRTGDPTEGLRHATRAVADLPHHYRDHLVTVTARDVARALPAGAEKSPEAAEYRELLAMSGKR